MAEHHIKIKTRDIYKGTIKTLNKAATAAGRLRAASVQAKNTSGHSTDAQERNEAEYASDRMENGVENAAHEMVRQFEKQGQKAVDTTRKNIENIQRFKEKRAEKSLKKQPAQNSGVKTPKASSAHSKKAGEQAQKRIRQSARSSGNKTIKTVGKGSAKTAQKTVKTAERTAKTTIKTTKQAAKAAQKAAKASAKAAQKAAQAAKATAKAVIAGVKAAVKAVAAVIKAIIAAVKGLIAAIAAGGWVAVLIIVILCLIGMLIFSIYGIFASGEDSGTGMSMQTAVQGINADYDAQLQAAKDRVSYDELEMSGSRAVWKDVLAIYAIKMNTDQDSPQEVATMDASKMQILNDIFWEMNKINTRTESKTETQIIETDDGQGNIVETESTVTKTYLYITVSHKTVEEMAAQYGFSQEQKEYLAELLKEENNPLWASVLYGISYSDNQIVTAALSQVGNVGGEPYWSWYGFDSRVEWCACFVSWCANECGYIDTGIIPKFAGCVNGVQWFQERGRWTDGSEEPEPGMIIFFDWDNKGQSGPQDGLADHVGIVEKVENGIVYTVEGNYGDRCKINEYEIGHYEILGYGVPQY